MKRSLISQSKRQTSPITTLTHIQKKKKKKGVFVIPMACAFATILIKVKSLSDGFNIRRELNSCFVVFFVSFLLYLLIMVYGYFRPDDIKVRMIASTFLITTTINVVAYIKAYFIVVAAYRKDPVDQALLAEIDELPLEVLLSKRDWFQAFMQHLVSEFSIENLLFTCEVQQFRSTLHYQKLRFYVVSVYVVIIID
ncbi:hypothetical protein RFI_15235 [Reticulomyxa filosa]|uniref:RGS domain-containing protein n=1 Tax=Reticulomyxa filosa TaxID=46433 RepID=X6N9J4_RETFI|nr:hypothetical protein RFI_15235 [Reticulomyxa filosa]|eukprot:ETO21967.1 hypothetical protein RFI_15235 [Reticulomyxa filosa]